jgi:eukaryotic-like serine/threonine-protein kinase
MPRDPAPIPERIGKYPIVREIGQGATSRVYLARDSFARRDVAVKVFSQYLRNDEVSARRFKKVFLSEASLVGRLNHPHIAAIYDAASDDQLSYLVMEYVGGGTLETHCRAARLPLEQVVEIAFKCARALDFALQNGVIHRDIKPANVLVVAGTEIKISDFGTAWQEGGDQTTQLTGVGSPAYMSPEQIRDLPLSQQTDIYSLGVVMYQLLTGQLPFTGSNKASLTYQVLNFEPNAPSVLRPEIPRALDQIVLKAMKKATSERYRTWREFAVDLTGTFNALRVRREEDYSDTEKFNAIKAHAFFQEFSDVEIWEVLRLAVWRRIRAQQTVVREGEHGESFYFLAQGEAQITRKDKPLSMLKPGDCFGEMLYFAETTALRTTTITTTTEVVVAEIKAESLKQATDACQVQFNKAFLRILMVRLNEAQRRIAED